MPDFSTEKYDSRTGKCTLNVIAACPKHKHWWDDHSNHYVPEDNGYGRKLFFKDSFQPPNKAISKTKIKLLLKIKLLTVGSIIGYLLSFIPIVFLTLVISIISVFICIYLNKDK